MTRWRSRTRIRPDHRTRTGSERSARPDQQQARPAAGRRPEPASRASRAAGRPAGQQGGQQRARSTASTIADAIGRASDPRSRSPAQPAGFAFPRCCPRLPWVRPAFSGGSPSPMLAPWPPQPALPLFHLYGDPPDDQAFDFIHVETIASRSSVARLDDPRAPPSQPVPDPADRARRRRDDVRGGDGAASPRRPRSWCRRRWRTASASSREVTDGWVVSFTEDVAAALGERSGEALQRLQGARGGAGGAARRRDARSGGCPRCAATCTRRASSRARASASRCADCWR